MRISFLVLLLCFCSRFVFITQYPVSDLCLPSLLAAPTSSTDRASSSTTLHTISTTQSSPSDHTSTWNHPHHPEPSLSNEFHNHTRPAPIVGPFGHFPPRPTRVIPPPPAPSDVLDQHQHHQPVQSPIAIFFEVLGGLVGLALLVSCTHCFYHYNRTPKRDRISAVLERHHLERELAELDRNPLALRRSPTSDPLPLYLPPPPTYEAAALTRSPTNPAQRSGYTEVATASPSSSPTSSPQLPTRQLESVPSPASTIPRPSIPPTPDR
jgi:hypothetical protein